MKKILLLGSGGQLGTELKNYLENVSDIELVSSIRSDYEITEDSLKTFLTSVNPDMIINCAAYTNVDKAEDIEDTAECFKVNSELVKLITDIAPETKLIHFSTDYVFDGSLDSKSKNTETDDTKPINVYGQSKLAGEEHVLKNPNNLVLRISSVHGQHGNNFVHTMLKLFAMKDSLNVINNIYMTPTWTGLVCENIEKIIKKDLSGVYNLTSNETVTWFDFAMAIKEISNEKFNKNFTVDLNPIPSSEYPTPASRPENSSLCVSKISNELGIKLPSYRDGLEKHIKQINE